MAVLKKHFFANVYFSLDATDKEITAETNEALSVIKSLGFADAQITVRGPFKGELATNFTDKTTKSTKEIDYENINYEPALIVTAEVRP